MAVKHCMVNYLIPIGSSFLTNQGQQSESTLSPAEHIVHLEKYHLDEMGEDHPSKTIAWCWAKATVSPDGDMDPEDYDYTTHLNSVNCAKCLEEYYLNES